jgi:hypothetical protein
MQKVHTECRGRRISLMGIEQYERDFSTLFCFRIDRRELSRRVRLPDTDG